MSGSEPVSQKALQREIDELREQAMLLLPGRKRNQVLARADALEVIMKTFRVLHHQLFSLHASILTKSELTLIHMNGCSTSYCQFNVTEGER
jgi:hypothetical protein